VAQMANLLAEWLILGGKHTWRLVKSKRNDHVLSLSPPTALPLSNQFFTSLYVFSPIGTFEAHPVSKVPWGCLQKQNTISWKYLLQQIQQVFSYFSTYSPPELRHLSYHETNF
jgi:hypothetical protein